MELGLASPRAINVLERARQRAAERDQTHIGAEHLFLALIEDEHAIPVQVLSEFVNVGAARDRLAGLMDSAEYRTPSNRTVGEPD